MSSYLTSSILFSINCQCKRQENINLDSSDGKEEEEGEEFFPKND